MAGSPSGVTSRCTSPVVPRGPSPPVGTLAQKAGGAATDTIAHVTISPSPLCDRLEIHRNPVTQSSAIYTATLL